MASHFYARGLQNFVATNTANYTHNITTLHLPSHTHGKPQQGQIVFDGSDVTWTAVSGSSVNVTFHAVLEELYKPHIVNSFKVKTILLHEIYDAPVNSFYVGNDYTGKLTAWLTEQLLVSKFVHAFDLSRRAKAEGLHYPARQIRAAAKAMGFAVAGSMWLRLPQEHPWRS